MHADLWHHNEMATKLTDNYQINSKHQIDEMLLML